ncbi:MAG: hypothetical protein ACI8ZM_004726 [Crocinitomix sp.]|jgi:hypothetical protein
MKNKDKAVTQTLDSLRKMVMGFIPGSHVAEEFIQFGENLRTARVLDFIDRLKKALEELTEEDLNSENFNSEVLHDIFYTILNKVRLTSSEYKLEKFKNILTNQILEPVHEDFLILKYTEILESLNDIQILILLYMRKNKSFKDSVHLMRSIDDREFIKRSLDNSKEECHVKLDKQLFSIPRSDFELYVDDLIGKGLLRNSVDMETKSKFKSNDFNKVDETSITKSISISNSGLKFLSFIEIGETEEPNYYRGQNRI